MSKHPNFFLVGAARAGTTSLWHYLRAHPDVYMPAALQGKEPSFFCDLTPPWAREYRELDKYLSLFEGAGRRRAIGDASTNYLVAPESAGRIREQYPDAKILIVLRNPADRAYSLYRFLCFLGLEPVTTFERALKREEDRAADERFKRDRELLYYAYLYYRSGLYSAQIQRYLDAFPREQIHILLNEDLKKDAAIPTMQGVYRFLGVTDDFEPEIAVHNQSQFPMSVRLQCALASRWNTHPVRPRGPARRRDRLHIPIAFTINTLLGQYRKQKARPETRRALIERFRPDIEATAALIGRDLSAWIHGRGAAKAAAAPAVAVQAG